MQQELEYLETDYEAKIEKLKNEKMQTETFYKEEIQNLKVQCIHVSIYRDTVASHIRFARLRIQLLLIILPL